MRASACALFLSAAVTACAAEPSLVPSLSHAAAPPTPDDASRAHPPPVTPDTGAGASLAMDSFELETGLRVVVVERHDQPVLVTHLLVARGAVDLGPRRTTTRMLLEASMKGTTTRDAFRLADDFDALGGPPRWWVDGDGASLQARSTATGLDGVLELLADVVTHPAFPPDAMIPLLDRWQKPASSAAFSFHPFELAVFGEAHPYTHEIASPTAGEEAPSLESLEALHDALMRPRHCTLIVVGDTARAAVEAAARRRLGSWTSSRPPMPLRSPDVSAPKTRFLHVDVDAPGNATIALVAPAPAARSSDRIALDALMRVLGGMSSSTSRRALTEDAAGASVGSYVVWHREGSYLRLGGVFPEGRAVDAVQSMLASVARARAGTFTDAEIAAARTTLLARWRHDVGDSVSAAVLVDGAVRQGVPLESVAERPQRMAGISAAELRRVAKTYLGESDLRLVVVGKGDENALGALGFGRAEHGLDH